MARTIADIEKPEPHNRLWKVKNLFVKGWVYLKYSSGKGKEESLFRIFLFFFSKSGLIFIGNFILKAIHLFFNIDIVGNRNKKAYQRWFRKNTPGESTLKKYKKEASEFTYQPLISILIVDLKGEPRAVLNTLGSLSEQVYPNWEIFVAAQPSAREHADSALPGTILPSDKKVNYTFIEQGTPTYQIKNNLLQRVQGTYVLFMTPGDLLGKDSLYEWVKKLQEFPQAEILYSDEDKMDRKGKCSVPLFKPDWSPDTLLAYNYLSKSALLKTSLLKTQAGFREGFDGAELYDLYLRATENAANIVHLNKILYRQKIRLHRSDSKSIARALKEALDRRKEKATVLLENQKGLTFSKIRYTMDAFKKISILIPTKDNVFLLRQCVESIFENSTYPDFEVIVVDNNSTEKDFFNYIATCERKYRGRFSCLRYEVPFNFSDINNFAVAHAQGEYIVLLNNDTKVITPDWLECMAEQVQRNSIGVVGVKLLYPDDSIQHAGIGFDQKQLPFHVYAGESKEMSNPLAGVPANYAALTAACIMVRKEVYHKIGGLDELLAVEFNDIDFCLKVKKAGYHNIYLPYVELYHYESSSRGSSHSSGAKYERHLREKNLFLSRWSECIRGISIPYFKLS